MLVLGGAVRRRDRHVRVREQREAELVLVGELLIRVHRVGRAAQDGDVVRGELGMQVLEGCSFRGSSAGACPRVEPQNEPLARVILERDRRARV